MREGDSQHLLRIARIFKEGGSAWRVEAPRDGIPHLVQRVPDEINVRYQAEVSAKTRAAEYLRAAWHEMYGRDPDPTEAFEQAVKAVEAAARPVLAPRDRDATLTKMTAQLRDSKHNWALELAAGAEHTTGVDALHSMMDALGKGQHTRHGKPDPSQPKDHTPAEAEAAVHLALTLVRWFQAGLVRPLN